VSVAHTALAKSYAEVALNALGVSDLRVLKRLRSALTDPELILPVYQHIVVRQPANSFGPVLSRQKFPESLGGFGQRFWRVGIRVGHVGIIGEFDSC
jgi:hypothetical protein